MRRYEWEKLKRAALNALPKTKHEMVEKHSLLSTLIAVDAMLNMEPSKQTVNLAFEDFLHHTREAIDRWDVRNAWVLIMATRKEGVYIIPKKYKSVVVTEIDEETDEWALKVSEEKMSEEKLAQIEALIARA